MIGEKFGKLEVLNKSNNKERYSGVNWVCRCDCGNECLKTTSELNSGFGRSCGCINKTHEMSNTRPYRIWHDMRRRCDKETRPGYEHYGGRGITYDSKWASFEGFWEDMGESYVDELELERNDVNSDYTKENCSWVKEEDQAKNKRKYKNNTLGIGNISVVDNKGVRTIKVRLQETETSKRHVKTFSLNKYSYDDALSMAVEWLEAKRKEFGYKESHGS